jgi:hypothetical protein
MALLRSAIGRPSKREYARVDDKLRRQREEIARLRAVEAGVRAMQGRE